MDVCRDRIEGFGISERAAQLTPAATGAVCCNWKDNVLSHKIPPCETALIPNMRNSIPSEQRLVDEIKFKKKLPQAPVEVQEKRNTGEGIHKLEIV